MAALSTSELFGKLISTNTMCAAAKSELLDQGAVAWLGKPTDSRALSSGNICDSVRCANSTLPDWYVGNKLANSFWLHSDCS